MINIKVYTKNKKDGTITSNGNSSNNINAGNAGGGGSWLENYFIYDQTRDCIICKRSLGSTNNVIAHIETDGVV